jgi:glycosyltransferase involved in cell wall biosynthesis
VGTAADGTADYRAFGSDRLAAKALLQIVNPFAMASVGVALREFDPDVALINMYEHQLSPAVLKRLRDVPTVLTVTDYKGICPIASKLLPDGRLCKQQAGVVCWRSGCVSLPHWLRDLPRYALIRSARQRVKRILACSKWMQRELALSGIEAEHVALPVAPPGPRFARAPSADPLFVFCGRLDPLKGVSLLLRAFARLRHTVPAARLRIVGAGPQRELLQLQVQQLGLSAAVTFRGWVPPDEVEHEFSDAWAVVVPSLWAEPLGLVAIEAVVRGVPVVASAAGGLGETIEHGVSGLLFTNGNEDELSRMLVDVATKRVFPTHRLPVAVVRDTLNRHLPERHIERLRAIFVEVARSPVSLRATRSSLPSRDEQKI